MRKGQQTRERILGEMTRLVRSQGFGATSVSDLVAATGLPKGALYHYFPGKDDLGLACLQRARDQFFDWLEGLLSGDDPGAALERFFQAVLERHEATGFVGGCLFGNTALEMGDLSERYTVAVTEVFIGWVTRLAQVIDAAQQTGQVCGDLSAQDLAQSAVAMIEGGIMLSRLTKSAAPLSVCLNSLRVTLALQHGGLSSD